jgi:hypothetical protein
MSIKLVQYFVHDATINGGRVGGSQTLTLSQNVESSTVTPWGNPSQSNARFIKKPTTSATLTKMLSDDYGPFFGGFDLRSKIYKRPVDKYDLGAIIYGGGSLSMKDCVLTGMRFSFQNTGFFTEELSFEGSVLSAAAGGAEGTGLSRSEEGFPYRRQHYAKGSRPSSTGSAPLLSIEVSLSISYGTIPTYGKFKTYDNKIVSLPVECTATYEVLDLGYSGGGVEATGDAVNDDISYENVFITTVPVSIDLGGKNVLVSIERSGADAGDSAYSTLKYTYKNTDNTFDIIVGSANSQYNSLWD